MQELNKEDFLRKIAPEKIKKVGYVCIIGRPNVGKSTFLNNLIGEKISIVSSIPQTTRRKVLGIYNDDETQIVFIDTPGFHIDSKTFNEQINKQALNSIKDANVVLYFIDSSRPGGIEEKKIKEIIALSGKPVIKVYTKSDLNTKIQIPQKGNVQKISSITKEGYEELIQKTISYFKKGPLFYPEEFYTSQDMYFRISEIIREKVFLNTKEEVPHAIFVEIQEIEDKKDILNIVAYVYTETTSQKYILIGKGGTLVQRIGTKAREDLEKVFGKKVFLALRVKVKEKWRQNEQIVKNLLP